MGLGEWEVDLGVERLLTALAFFGRRKIKSVSRLPDPVSRLGLDGGSI